MSTLWLILYASLIGFICLLVPGAIFFYESDPEHIILRRLLRTIGYLFLTLIITVAIFFISWNFLKFVDLPYAELEHTYEDIAYIAP